MKIDLKNTAPPTEILTKRHLPTTLTADNSTAPLELNRHILPAFSTRKLFHFCLICFSFPTALTSTVKSGKSGEKRIFRKISRLLHSFFVSLPIELVVTGRKQQATTLLDYGKNKSAHRA